MIKPTDFVRRQHTTPRTYLKHFSSKNKVCLYHLNNQYKRTIQENINIGNGKIFGGYEEFYYDFPNKNNIQFLEKSVFKKWEDNDYNLIIKTITERAGAIHCKNILLNWIAMMKIRSGSFRDNYTRLFYFLNKAVFDHSVHFCCFCCWPSLLVSSLLSVSSPLDTFVLRDWLQCVRGKGEKLWLRAWDSSGPTRKTTYTICWSEIDLA